MGQHRATGVDFGRTASDYATHRAGFPESLFERLRRRGDVAPGDRVLDLGTGTGTVARGMARLGAAVTGLDPAVALLEQARRLAEAEGLAVEFVAGTAEETGLADRSFEVVAAGQCWHWFDGARAAAEARRILVPGGRLILLHFDWIPIHGNVVEATERLIEKHNPEWRLGGGNGLPGVHLRAISEAGFRGIETFSYDLDVPYTHEAWRGRVRASAGVAASLSPEAVKAFDREHAALLALRFPGDPLAVFHRVWAMVARLPA